MLKELRNLWEKDEHDLPRENREFSESNTLLLLDDSPYMALLNPSVKECCSDFTKVQSSELQ
ncbi:hypothetical protein JHK85_053417 [Glycine max]|nr:hypothetical protein JHK85_053417 [Glycine max]